MSKAFTKEDEGGEEPRLAYAPPWPADARNYITAAGYAKLRAEREGLVIPPATTPGAREVQRRAMILDVHLEAAEVVPPTVNPTQVQFGTQVLLAGDRERSYAIVGVDEVDAARGHISWLSPIAKALLGRKVGDEVVLRSPRGEEDVTIVAISGL
jgi:transcription elongation factor GreB